MMSEQAWSIGLKDLLYMYRKMNTIFLRDTAGNPEWARQRHPANHSSLIKLAIK